MADDSDEIEDEEVNENKNENGDDENDIDNSLQVADEIPTIAQQDMRINFDIIRTKDIMVKGRKKYTVCIPLFTVE